jgi:hypothetical protein
MAKLYWVPLLDKRIHITTLMLIWWPCAQSQYAWCIINTLVTPRRAITIFVTRGLLLVKGAPHAAIEARVILLSPERVSIHFIQISIMFLHSFSMAVVISLCYLACSSLLAKIEIFLHIRFIKSNWAFYQK